MDMLLDDVEVPELTEAELELLIAAYPNPKPLPALPGDDMPKPTHCAHGMYIAKGDDTAKYCTACNPSAGGIIAPAKRKLITFAQLRASINENTRASLDGARYNQPELLVDTSDYMNMHGDDRIAANKQFFAEV